MVQATLFQKQWILKPIRNADAGFSRIEIPRVSRDEQRVVEACRGPDDRVWDLEFVFLAERDRFSSDSFVKFNHWKLPEKILPHPSQYVGRCANKDFHPRDPADRDSLVKR